MADLYETLGVAKTATEKDIRSAYRKLAKASHPDLHPGDKAAEQRFKEISAAYAILGDAEKRKRYDAGEIDETGAERQPERRYYRHYAESEPGFKYGAGREADFEDFGDIFSEMLRRQRRQDAAGETRMHFRARGADVAYRLAVDFLEAVNGAKKRIDLPDGRTLDVTIPPGTDSGRVLRLAGMGGEGLGGGPRGDALIEIEVRPHPEFRREGNTIRSTVPITLKEAVAGGSVRVATVEGPVNLRIPRGSNSGTVLRLRGKGVPGPRTSARGDHLVELRVMLPEPPDAELEELVSNWEARHPYNPRTSSGGA
jgi:DnaJ-class molecular chaperone